MKEVRIEKKTNSIIVIVLVLLFCVGAFICGAIIISQNSPPKRIANHIFLGDRYFADMKYEEAILSYTTALEINPQNEETQRKIIDAYLEWGATMAKEGEYTDALRILKDGLDKTGSSLIEKQIHKYQEIIHKSQSIGTSTVSAEINDNESAERIRILEELKNSIIDENLETIYMLFKSGEMNAYFEGLPNVYIVGKEGVNNTLSGTGIGVYRYNDNKLGEKCYLIYVGDYVNGLRSGHGKWIWSRREEISIFDVDWVNDYPQGSFVLNTMIDVSEITMEQDHTYATFITEKGTVEKGIYVGNCNITWKMLNGNCEMHNWDVEYVNGMSQAKNDDISAYCKACNARYLVNKSKRKVYGID